MPNVVAEHNIVTILCASLLSMLSGCRSFPIPRGGSMSALASREVVGTLDLTVPFGFAHGVKKL